MFGRWFGVAGKAAMWSSLVLFAAIGGAVAPQSEAATAAPGDTSSVVTLQASFDADNPNHPPDLSLPGSPTGDFLTLDTSAGTVNVVTSYDGLSRPVEIRQTNDPGAAMLLGHAVPSSAAPEKATVRWRAVQRDDEAAIHMAAIIRASNGSILASVEYLHQNALSYNGSTLPVSQIQHQAQQFTVVLDFVSQTSSLSIDGVAVPGFQAVPFQQQGGDVARFDVGGTGGHPQTIYVDDISVVAFYRVPDHAPTISAPATVSGEEASPVAFSVTASDPDGEAIASLTGAPIPTGASFVANGAHTLGSFDWTPGYDQAGSYDVTFTAANALSSSATTHITIANHDRAPTVTAPASVAGVEGTLFSFNVTASDPDGDAISVLGAAPLPPGAGFVPALTNTVGAFTWKPGFTQAGSYDVTFTATAGSLSGTATTSITIANGDQPPSVDAPTVVDGEEGGELDFGVTASDPDGDALSGLAADLSGLPAGNSASFNVAPGFASGTFHWPMKRGEAGTYLVTFTATNASTGSATTKINVAFAGTSVTGELIWTPAAGMEGTYTVTFTATNNLGEEGSGTTQIVVTTGSSATTPPSLARNVPLSPESPLRGPIISVNGLTSTTTGKTTTVSATATDPGTSLAASIARARGASGAGQATHGIISFVADLTGLPAGHNAIFVIDQDPLVTAPAGPFTLDPGTPLTFTVSASDPHGDAILGLGANLSTLPAGNTATFSSNPAHTSGTFAWTPRAEDAGTFVVTFSAFNQLVGTAATTITVNPVAPATIFIAGPKKLRLSSNRPFGCVSIQPVNGSFSLFNVDLTSIRMVSAGTGVVSEIAAGSMKEVVIGDRNGDLIQDMQVCFSKGDLRALFSLLRGANTVTVVVRGDLVSGGSFAGSLTMDIVAGGGPLQTTVAPNPLNPSATLRFATLHAGRVRVSLFDLSGRLVRTLWDEPAAAAGPHEVVIDGRGADRRPLSSGVYFYRIESVDGVDKGSLTVLK